MNNKQKILLVGLGIVVIIGIAIIALKVISPSPNPNSGNTPTINNENKVYTVNLITNDIDGWKFIETSQKTNENGIPIHTAYYSKELSNSRIEESKVDIYVFANQSSAKNELNKKSNMKGCGYFKEKTSNTVIFECFQSGIWWTSNNLLINIGGSPRTSGMYIDAYDLVVCPLNHDNCEPGSTVYAPKAIFDVYVEKYPAS